MKTIFFLPIKKVRLAQLGMVAVAVAAWGIKYISSASGNQAKPRVHSARDNIPVSTTVWTAQLR
jgi:hypothetical protein